MPVTPVYRNTILTQSDRWEHRLETFGHQPQCPFGHEFHRTENTNPWGLPEKAVNMVLIAIPVRCNAVVTLNSS